MNKEQELEVCKFNELSLTQISKKFKISIKQVKRILKDHNLEKEYKIGTIRKYPLNETFFDDINTEVKAYFLGLLYADGCNNTKEGKTTISLQEPDKDILIKFTEIIQPLKPLKYVVKYGNRQNQYKLTICSRKISDNLIKYGCMANKTFLLTFPNFYI